MSQIISAELQIAAVSRTILLIAVILSRLELDDLSLVLPLHLHHHVGDVAQAEDDQCDDE